MVEWGKKRSHRILEDSRDWSGGLPEGILDTISRKVALCDCTSFSKVCKSWRNSLMESVVRCPKLASRRFPWLVMSGAQGNSKTRSCFSVLESKLWHLELPTKCYGNWFWGSFEDWLIMAKPVRDFVDISLLNLFTGAEVLLPRTINGYAKLVFTEGYPDCMYLMFEVPSVRVALWIPGTEYWGVYDLLDESEVFEQAFRDAIYYDGCFYLLTRKYNILVIDVASASQSIKRDGYMAEIRRHTQFHQVQMCYDIPSDLASLGSNERDRVSRYLLEFNGEILLVCRLLKIIERKAGEEDDIKTYGFKVFRLDLCLMKWVELDSLGDKVLFLNRMGSRCVPAKDLGLDFRMANCIYFTNEYEAPHLNEWDLRHHHPHRSKMDDWGIFRLDGDGEDRCFSYEAKTDRWSPIWITVPLWWYFQHKNESKLISI